jgi:hypothetical protein
LVEKGIWEEDNATAMGQMGLVPSIYNLHSEISCFKAGQFPLKPVSATIVRQNASSTDMAVGYIDQACIWAVLGAFW